MNAASLSKSPRLQRVDRLLSDGAEYSTMQVIQQANVMAVNSIISELRLSGRVINCRRARDVWYYRRDLAAEKKQRAAA